MIISEKILYLRKKLGYTQEELAEKLNVSRQSISKWESAQSIPDTAKIMEMAKIFSVSTDFLLKDEIEKLDGELTNENDEDLEILTIEKVNDLIVLKNKSIKMLALAIFLFIISADILIAFASFSKNKNIGLVIGLSILIVFVVLGIALCISSTYIMDEHKYLNNGKFSLSNNVDGILIKNKKVVRKRKIKNLIISVSIIILSIIPLLIAAVLNLSGNIIIICICLLILTISISVPRMVIHGCEDNFYELLLSDKKIRTRNGVFEKISSIYWVAVVVIYLAWSFITNDWNKTWIVWPIAAILSSLISIFETKN